MAKQLIFTTKDGLKCTMYINHENKIYLAAGDDLEEVYRFGHFVFDLEDAKDFRDELINLINILENE